MAAGCRTEATSCRTASSGLLQDLGAWYKCFPVSWNPLEIAIGFIATCLGIRRLARHSKDERLITQTALILPHPPHARPNTQAQGRQLEIDIPKPPSSDEPIDRSVGTLNASPCTTPQPPQPLLRTRCCVPARAARLRRALNFTHSEVLASRLLAFFP